MRTLVVAATVAVVLAPVGAAGERAADRTAALRVVRTPMLTLSGSRFLPGERVRVTVMSPLKHTKRVTAGRRGTFVVRFEFVPDRCLGTTVVAVGSRGSRAQVKLPMPVCPPGL